MKNREERMSAILSICKNFEENSVLKLHMGYSVYDLFMEQFAGDLQNMYAEVSKDEIKEDVKILLDNIYHSNDNGHKEFVIGVLLQLIRMISF
ncbi:MAG: hypothetical protein ACRCZ2_03595 [Fusobacteriaceae bacterium]